MASPISPPASPLENSGEGFEFTDSFPLNQLGLPDYMARHPELYPDYNPDEDLFGEDYGVPATGNLLPSPFEGDAGPSQELVASSQAFREFFEERKDPIVTLEFCTSLVVLVHEGRYEGPAHMVSRAAYEEFKRRDEDQCPTCRRSIMGAEDISEKIKAYLKDWTQKRFLSSGDNALHKALELSDSSVFFALLTTEGAQALLFEKNKADISPLQALINKADYKTAFDETLTQLSTPKALFHFSDREARFYQGSKRLRVEDKLSLGGNDYTLKALNHSAKGNTLYLLSGDHQLFRMEVPTKSLTSFKLSLKGKNGDSSFFHGDFRLAQTVGRGNFPHCSFNTYISRTQWTLRRGAGGGIELSEKPDVLNKARLLRISPGGKTLRYSFERPIPLQKGDQIVLNEKVVFSVGELQRNWEEDNSSTLTRSSRKRSRAEMEGL